MPSSKSKMNIRVNPVAKNRARQKTKCDERTNQSQYKVLVQFLEKNVSLAKGIESSTPRGRATAKEKWENIAKTLNALGPPIKDGLRWKSVYKDYKYKIKSKLSANLVSLNKTGGGKKEEYVFDDLQNRIIELLDLNTAVEGEGNSFGPHALNNSNKAGPSRKAENLEFTEPKSPSVEEAFNSFNKMLEEDEQIDNAESDTEVTEGNDFTLNNYISDYDTEVNDISYTNVNDKATRSYNNTTNAKSLTNASAQKTTRPRSKAKTTKSLLVRQIEAQEKYLRRIDENLYKMCKQNKENLDILKQQLEYQKSKEESKALRHSEKQKGNLELLRVKQKKLELEQEKLQIELQKLNL